MSGINKWLSLIVICFFSFLFSLPAIISGDKENNSEFKEPVKVNTEPVENSLTKGDSIVLFAKSLLGKRYKYASCGPDEFDCSGFVYYVFNKFNIKLSRSSYTMANEGKPVALEDARKGDLIFFKGTDLNDPSVGHVGIVISEKGTPVEFIHASSSKQNAVILTKLSESNYKARFIKVKRFL